MGERRSEGLRIHARLVLPWRELVFQAARSGGPGGQHVNKASTKVVLRFDVARSPTLGERQRARLLGRLEKRLNGRGELVIHASRHRERLQNERDACERLAAMLREGLRQEKRRKPTRPTRSSVERRLAEKKRRSDRKSDRRRRGEP